METCTQPLQTVKHAHSCLLSELLLLDLYNHDIMLAACRHWEYEITNLKVLSVEVSEDESAVVLAAVEVLSTAKSLVQKSLHI